MVKKLVSLTAVILLCVGICFASDPAEGYWISYDEKTEKATAGWKIWEEHGELFGTILSLAGYPQDVKAYGTKGKGPYKDFPVPGNMSEMKTVGTPWIFDLQKISEGVWAKGSIVDPNDGNKYKCKIIFHMADGKKYKNDTLEMRGEIGFGIGRSQYWVKAPKEKAEGLR